MGKPGWYLVLEAVRKTSRKGEITSKTLGLATGFSPAIASAWLGKFAKWGYVRRAGRSSEGGKTTLYELTDYGAEVDPPKRRHYRGPRS